MRPRMSAQPSPVATSGRCLNCDATLDGRFCSACGQRVVPPHPTARELVGDAWKELSGYDGRIAATFRGLLKPGRLTRHYVEGQRARYVSPVRLYLIVSLTYFLLAAAAPTSFDSRGRRSIGPGIRIDGIDDSADAAVTAAEREQMLKELDDAPWLLRPMLRAMATNPDKYRRDAFAVLPRGFFAMLPVFAGIVFLFYRRDTFPTSLVFAVHLHAFAFLALILVEAAKFTGSASLAALVGLVVTVALGVYSVLAFRAVFGGQVLKTLSKIAAIGVLYLLASMPAFFLMLLWAAVS